MTTIQMEATLAVSPADLWAKVRDVGHVSGLLDVVTESSLAGNKRECKLATGADLSETILGIDEEHRRVAYTITASPFPIESHAASMQVIDAGDGRSVFRWITDVTPDEMADGLSPLMAGEMDQLRATFGT